MFKGTRRRARSVTCHVGSHGITCHPTMVVAHIYMIRRVVSSGCVMSVIFYVVVVVAARRQSLCLRRGILQCLTVTYVPNLRSNAEARGLRHATRHVDLARRVLARVTRKCRTGKYGLENDVMVPKT